MFTKRAAASAALVLASTIAVNAADLTPAYTPAPPPPAVSYTPMIGFDWSGPYVGAYGGYLIGVGFGQAGAQAGYNFMLGNTFVAGIEVQAGGIWAFPGLLGEANANARLGAAFGDVLVYAEGGVGIIYPVAFTWNAGGGLEYAINNDFSVFGEAKAVGAFGGGYIGTTVQAGVNWHFGY